MLSYALKALALLVCFKTTFARRETGLVGPTKHQLAFSFTFCCLLQRADTVELTIGYHLLEGKMVDLKKPFAILEKQSTPVDVDAMEEDGHPQCNTEYKVGSQSTLSVWQRILPTIY